MSLPWEQPPPWRMTEQERETRHQQLYGEPAPPRQYKRRRITPQAGTQGDPLALTVIIILAGVTLLFYAPFLFKAAKESR